MMDLLVVLVVVGIALAWAGRAIWRAVRGRGGCSSCADAGSCPLLDNPELLADLSHRGQMGHLDKCNPAATDCQDLLADLEPRDPQA